jgi:putative transposase
MIKAYNLKHFINSQKKEKIIDLIFEYRKFAKKVAKIQWIELFKNGNLNKDLDIKNIETKLSARYKQVNQYQIVASLESYLSNRANSFKDYVLNSNLDEITKIKLLYINKYKKWFCNEIKMKNDLIDIQIIKLSRKIIKQTFKLNTKPNFKNSNLALDSKVVKVKTKNPNKAKNFDYWITLSSLEKGKTLKLPLKSNNYFDEKIGNLKNFVQINLNQNQEIKITLLKDIEKQNYLPQTPKIALDLGLKNLFASNNGDLFGRNFSKLIKKYDKYITDLAKNRQKQKLKTASKRYKNLISNLKNYLKNEINRVINRIINLYKPAEIVIEKLDFQSPKLSKKLNRVLNNFGKSIITQKFKSLKEEFGIKITEINPAYTSQECSCCGYVAKNNRKNQETFTCGFCNSKQNADVNASRNIFSRSSTNLKNIYLKKAFILDELIKRFIERNSSYNSLANVLTTNPYFKNYGSLLINKLLFSSKTKQLKYEILLNSI